MSDLLDQLSGLLAQEPRRDEPGWGALVRLCNAEDEPVAFAGRLSPAASLEETAREALRLAAEEDARFGPAGPGLAGGRGEDLKIELFLVRKGSEVSAEAPLEAGEGVFVVAAHRRAVFLAEDDRSPAEVLRGGCIAAGVHPDSLEDEVPPRMIRLEVVRVGPGDGPVAPGLVK